MAIGRRRTAPEPTRLTIPAAPTPKPEVDEYADEPYVSPSIVAARSGKKVNFGTDVLAGDSTTTA